MKIPLYQGGGENFYEARIVEHFAPLDCLRRFTVPLRSTDSLFLELPKGVDFIKADVEGHEFAVLQGARGVIRRSLPAIYVEVTSDPDEPTCPAAALLGYLDGEGYRPYWFDGRGLVRRRPGHRSVNYFFLTGRHLSVLEQAKIGIR